MNRHRFWVALVGLLFAGVILPLLGSALAHWLLPHQHWPHTPLHAVVEGVGAFAGLTLAGLLLVLRRYKENADHLLWIVCALIGMAILDGCHASCMPGVAFVWLRSLATLIGGLLFALIWLPERASRVRLAALSPAAILVAAALLGALVIIFRDALPLVLRDSAFTPIAVAVNVIGGVFFLLASLRFLDRYRRNGSLEDLLFANYCLLFGIAGLLFHFSQIWGADWWWWHLLRLLAYASVLGHTFFLHQQTQKELRDVSAVLQMEQALRESERRLAAQNASLAAMTADKARQTEVLRSILDGMSEGVFVADAEGSLILINPAAERMIGRPAEPTLAATQGTSEFYHPDTVTPLDVQDLPSTRAIRGEDVDDAEMYLRPHSTGKGIWISATARPLRDQSGSVRGGVVVFRDVTERKRAEEKLRTSEEQYRSLADLIPAVVWTARSDGSIDYANQFWFKYTGLTMPQTEGSGWTVTVHPDDVEHLSQVWGEALKRGEPVEVEYRIRRAADGVYHWFLAQGRPVRDREGQIVKWFGLLTDIEDQKQGQKVLERQNALVRLLHQITVAAYEAATVEEALEAGIGQVCAYTGWPIGHVYILAEDGSEELISTSIWHLDRPTDFERFVRVTEATRLRAGVGLPGRVLVEKQPVWIMDLTRDENFPRAKAAGDLGVKRAFAFPVLSAAGIVAVLEFFTGEPKEPDEVLLPAMTQIGMQLGQVFERKRAERALAAARDAAEAATRAKSEFLANMSHEIRTPVNAVLGMTHLALQTELTRKQRDYMTKIDGSAKTLLRTINDILDFSKIEAGRLEIESVEFDLEEVLDNLASLVTVKAEEKGLELHRAADAGRPYDLVLMDYKMPGMDGIEASRRIKKGSSLGKIPTIVMVTAYGREEVMTQAEAAGLEGFLIKPVNPSVLLNTIMEVFGQGRQQQCPPPEARASQLDMASIRGTRLLVAEDNEINQQVAREILESAGFVVDLAGNGLEALEKLRSRPYDAVLMDIQMPEMDGYEVCERLKADLKTHDVPVIFITAMSEVDDETKGFSLGAVDYITKPFRPPIVQARVATHIELALARKRLAAQNNLLRESLTLAANVQRSLLPRFPVDDPGLDVAGRMIPCDAVGGDYLDFLTGDDFAGRGFGVAVGDVSGHGAAAALLMTAARACLRMRASRPGGIAEVVTDVNRYLAVDLNYVERFMTFYLLAVRKDEVSWVSAGHESALLVDPRSGTIAELEGDGPILGIDADISLREHRAAFFEPECALALCTDGITEARNETGELFGRARLKQSLLRHASGSASDILDGVMRDVLDFRGTAPQSDDLTLVVLRRTP